MSALKRSIGISVVTQYAELLIQFGALMILARLITSEEVGIYSVAAFLMTLLHVFRDFGVARYVIKVDHLDPATIRSAIGVALLLAWAVALLLLACSGLLADLYDEPQITSILYVMSASFAATPIGSVVGAIFRRNMQMERLAVVRMGSVICHVIVAVSLAWLGYGAMSLAWANFANIASYGILAALLRGPGVPLMPSFRNMREILSFGSISSLGSVANVAGTNSPDVIIGKAISLAATGYFSRGNGLVQMFKTLVSGAIVPLILPYFSQLRREKKDMVEPYHTAIAHLCGFAWPFYAVMAIMALPVVRTLYGDNWDVSVPVVRVLCLAGIVSTLTTFAGEVMIAYGHIRVVTKLQLLNQPVRVVAVLVGCQYGLSAVGFGLVIAECVALATTSYYLYQTNGVRFAGVMAATVKSMVLTAFSVVAPVLVVLAWPGGEHKWLQMAIGGGGALCGWLIAIVLTGHPINQHLQQAQAKYWPSAPWGK
ncbi:MAG: oligosaccharide flippase family protein [Telluria sp.]